MEPPAVVRTGVDHTTRAGRRDRVQHGDRAAVVNVQRVLEADVGTVRAGQVDHGVGPLHRRRDGGAVGHRGQDPSSRALRQGRHVEQHQIVPFGQDRAQARAEESGGAGDEDTHQRITALGSHSTRPGAKAKRRQTPSMMVKKGRLSRM